jgi:hypothetical protein
MLEIYNELIKINDEDFFTFLLKAAIPLLRIDKIGNYLRIIDTTKDINTTESKKIKSYECLDELFHLLVVQTINNGQYYSWLSVTCILISTIDTNKD